MSHLRIKLSGLTQENQTYLAWQNGIIFSGFHFDKNSERAINVLPKHKKLKEKLTEKNPYLKIGEFANQNLEEVLFIANDYKLFMVQLNGAETPDYCRKISEKYYCIKKFSLTQKPTTAIWDEIKTYHDATRYLLFDCTHNGEFFPEFLEGYPFTKPFFLSGDITINDAEKIVQLSKTPIWQSLYAIEISYAFEKSVGVFDMKQIKKFTNQICFLKNSK